MASAVVGVAGGSPLPPALRDRLEGVQENTDILCSQIQKLNTPQPSVPLCQDTGGYLVRLKQTADLVSSACTKLAVLFSKAPPPSPDECGCLCHQLEQATLQLVSVFHQVGSDQGKTLKAEVKSSIFSILSDVKKLAGVLIKEGCSSKHSRLQGTGLVWESCAKVAKISQDNKTAVAKVCLSQLRLLQDAQKEAEELQFRRGATEEDMFDEDSDCDMEEISDRLQASTMEGEEEEEERRGRLFQWSETDMATVTPCLSVLQVAVGVTKLTCRGVVTSGGVASTAALDGVADEVRLLSQLMDDIVSELPAPVDTILISKLCKSFGEALSRILDAVEACGFPHHSNSEATPTLSQHRETLQTAMTNFS